MTDLVEILKSWPAASAAAIAAIAAIVKSVQSIFEFHNEHLRNRKLRRLELLSKECEDNEYLKFLVRKARDEEISRNLFGKICTPELTTALAKSYETEKFSLSILRMALPYIEVVQGSLFIKLGLQSRLSFWVSLILIFIMSLYLLLLVYSLAKVHSPLAFGAILSIGLFYLIFVRIFVSDARAVIAARIVKKILEGSEKQPNNAIKLDHEPHP